jgi:hypothetical protein
MALALWALAGCNQRRERPDAAVAPGWTEVAGDRDKRDVPCVDGGDVLSIAVAGGDWSVCQLGDVLDECLTVAPDGTITTVAEVPEAPPEGDIHVAAFVRGDTVEVCALFQRWMPAFLWVWSQWPRACSVIAPALRPGERIADAVPRDDGAVATVVITEDVGWPTRLEFWDVPRRRRTGEASVGTLYMGSTDRLRHEYLGDALLFASPPEKKPDAAAEAWLFGLDGRLRASFHFEERTSTDAIVAAVDPQGLVGYQIATGARLGPFPAGDDVRRLVGVGGTLVAVLHHEGAIDLVDLASGRTERREPPACD